MKYEYLAFNILVIIGPVLFSFDRRVHYVSRWPVALLVSAIVMIPYIIWDVFVTGSHWWFNENYTLNVRLAGLPIGEWLFSHFGVPHHGFPVTSGITAGVIILTGVILFLRLLHKNPRLKEA